MAFKVSALPNYVEQRRLPLIKNAVLGAKTVSLINLQTDIKSEAAINLIKSTAPFQDGSNCGWNANGDVTLSQRIIKTGFIKINQSFCDKAFYKTWAGYETRVAAGQKTLPFQEYFTAQIVDEVKAGIEKLVWQGDTTKSSDATVKWTDGFIKILTDASDSVKPTMTGKTNAYDAIRTVYMAIPEQVLAKAVIFVGADTFRALMMEMVDKNYYHYPADGQAVEEIILPGTNTKVIAVNGLNGTKQIVAADPDNLFYGCDLVNDEEKFELWYSQDAREFRLAIEFNAGVQVAYPNETVIGKIADA